ncbi:aliphatic nitrilase [Sphingomonas sp. H39-1-10]|uniref:nitrilase-related carbon-nitrogen hydrolase n=1 Tax=Sphingomonas pollutisoli TaxID=3030829 RepID=UPI0023BA0319|nr:nitrilase-related carbon-nitrogen hydrolase [Sphingomonas pollutisoli]MDF0490078.1 aliphatic nitrilase [Sphingomonas pollutisoli]
MTDSRTVRAAAVQIAPALDTLANTVDRVLAAASEAASKGAELVVFPETFLPWYPYFSIVHGPALIGDEHLRLYKNGVVAPGPVTEALSAAARQHHIVISIGINERDHGTLYNSLLIFDADGTLRLKHRKLSPAYHERMIWGVGDGSTLKVIDTAVGRVGGLICWEHYNPLARYALMAQHEDIHVSMFPGALFGPTFADQTEVQIRNHALESGCFVVNATGWLTEEQIAEISGEHGAAGMIRGGSITAIIDPEGRHVVPPLTSGEGILIADLNMDLNLGRKRLMDSVGHFSRPELLRLLMTNPATSPAVTAQDLTPEQVSKALKLVGADGAGTALAAQTEA